MRRIIQNAIELPDGMILVCEGQNTMTYRDAEDNLCSFGGGLMGLHFSSPSTAYPGIGCTSLFLTNRSSREAFMERLVWGQCLDRSGAVLPNYPRWIRVCDMETGHLINCIRDGYVGREENPLHYQVMVAHLVDRITDPQFTTYEVSSAQGSTVFFDLEGAENLADFINRLDGRAEILERKIRT